MHANADDESLPTHIVKLIELSKRLEANGKDGWIKAQMYRDQFDSKKRPSAQKARDWMNEAVTLGYGRTRGTGNRLEYHWRRDNNDGENNPPYPDNLGKLGKLKEDLGKTLPVVETIENKGGTANLGKFGTGIPSLSGEEAECLNTGGEGSEQSDEGGYLPEASLSTPQESCEAYPLGEKGFGNNLGKPVPNFPEVPEVCDSEAQVVTVEEYARAPQGTYAVVQRTVDEPLKVGERVFVQSCPHTDKLGPYIVLEIDGEFARVEMFTNPIKMADLRKAQ
jgi:hypothetical protein